MNRAVPPKIYRLSAEIVHNGASQITSNIDISEFGLFDLTKSFEMLNGFYPTTPGAAAVRIQLTSPTNIELDTRSNITNIINVNIDIWLWNIWSIVRGITEQASSAGFVTTNEPLTHIKNIKRAMAACNGATINSTSYVNPFKSIHITDAGNLAVTTSLGGTFPRTCNWAVAAW